MSLKDIPKRCIISSIRSIADGAEKIKLKVYLPSVIVDALVDVIRNTEMEWKSTAIAPILRLLADKIE